MANKFKGSNRPGGSTGLLDPSLAFDDTDRLVREAERNKTERDNQRTLLAKRNRDDQNSLAASFEPASQSRTLALNDERQRRGEETQMHVQRIQEARKTADRNATNKANQSIKQRQELVNLIKDVAGTSLEAYNTFEQIKDVENRKELFKIGIRNDANTEDLIGIKNLNLSLINEGQEDHIRYKAYIDAGWSHADIVAVNRSRPAAFYAEKINTLQRDIKNFAAVSLEGDQEYQDLFNAATVNNDWAKVSVAIDEKIANYLAIGKDLNPNDPYTKKFFEQIRNIKVAQKTKFLKLANTHAKVTLDTERANLVQASLNEDPGTFGKRTYEAAAASDNPVEYIKQQFESLSYLAAGADGAELIKIRDAVDQLANTIGPDGKLQIDQDPRWADDARKAREAAKRASTNELDRSVLESKQKTKFYRDKFLEMQDNPATTLEEYQALKQAARLELDLHNKSNFLNSIDAYTEINFPETQGEKRFYADLNAGSATRAAIDRGDYGKDPETINKLNKALASHENNDKKYQTIISTVKSDLSTALGYQTGATIKHASYYRALDDAMEQLQSVKINYLRQSNGDLAGAYVAMNNWWVANGPGEGKKPHEGRYSVWNRADFPNKTGFSNPLFHGIQEGASNTKTIKTYTDIHNTLKENNITTEEAALTELTSNSNISKQLISDSQLKAWLQSPHTNQGVGHLLTNLHNISGKNSSRRELAEQIAKSRMIDVPPTAQEIRNEAARKIQQEIESKFGYNNNQLMMSGTAGVSNVMVVATGHEGGYDSSNNGIAGIASIHKTPSKMTLGQIQAAMDNRTLFAVGRFQMTANGAWPGFKRWLNEKGYGDDTVYSPEIQNLGWNYTINVKRPIVGKYLNGNPNISTEQAALELSAEFASIGVPYAMKAGSYGGGWPRRDIQAGESLYVGVGGNAAAGGSHLKMMRALRLARKEGSQSTTTEPTVVPTTDDQRNYDAEGNPTGTYGKNRPSGGPPKSKPTHITKKEEDEGVMVVDGETFYLQPGTNNWLTAEDLANQRGNQ